MDTEENDNTDIQKVGEKALNPAQVHAMEIAQMNEIAQDVIRAVDEDRDKSDELYDFMRDQIEVEACKNPATREAMAKALDLKMRGTDQKIALLRLKAQLLNPAKGGININLNVPGSGEFDQKKGRNTNDFIAIVENLELDK